MKVHPPTCPLHLLFVLQALVETAMLSAVSGLALLLPTRLKLDNRLTFVLHPHSMCAVLQALVETAMLSAVSDLLLTCAFLKCIDPHVPCFLFRTAGSCRDCNAVRCIWPNIPAVNALEA
jgi:hypothetical protein